jgi:uncharacterized membrane protein (DUF4010 family)
MVVDPTALGLAAALGGGLLIGLERERRKGRGDRREAAGIRSFALAALGGGVAQVLAQPALVALGALLVAMLAAVAYWKSRERVPGQPAPDPGLTTELALFITYLVGVLSVQQPALGAGAAALVAALLAARERLHRLATQMLSEAEVHDALLLAALTLVLLPLAPAAPVPWLGGMAPRTLLLTMVLILALQAAGHVAGRLLGARAGLALSGLFSGFVSSTATIAAMAARARAEPGQRGACQAGAMFSTTATWLQVMLLVGALAPAALPALLPAALAGAVAALLTALLQARVSRGAVPTQASSRLAHPSQGPLRLREALVVAVLLAAVALLVSQAQQWLGDKGLLLGTALAALADAHAPVAALATLHTGGRIDGDTLRLGTLLAVAANACTRAATAVVAGGAAFGSRVALSLLFSTACAAAVAWAVR